MIWMEESQFAFWSFVFLEKHQFQVNYLYIDYYARLIFNTFP